MWEKVVNKEAEMSSRPLDDSHNLNETIEKQIANFSLSLVSLDTSHNFILMSHTLS